MIDLTKRVVYSVWRIPVATWQEFFGVEFPSKTDALNAGFRPLSRADGYVYAVCTVIDGTPDKRRWAARGLGWLLEQGAEVVSGGGRPEDVWKLPAEHRPHVLRALVRTRAGRQAVAGEARARPRSLPLSAVEEGDVVEATNVRPVNLFTGRRR